MHQCNKTTTVFVSQYISIAIYSLNSLRHVIVPSLRAKLSIEVSGSTSIYVLGKVAHKTEDFLIRESIISEVTGLVKYLETER